MVDIEIVSLDGTGDPARDGCTATATVIYTDSGNYPDYDWQWSYDYYQLVAEEAKGWEFVRFEWTHVKTSSGSSPVTTPREESDKTYPTSGRDNSLRDGSETLGDDWWLEEIQNCKAVFRRHAGTGQILCNQAGVILHGASGSVLYDD